MWLGFHIIRQIAHHIQIQIAIPIRIKKGGTSRPSTTHHARLLLPKTATTIILIQHIGIVTRRIKIEIAIIVIVPNRTPHAISHTRRTRHSGKPKSAIVSVKRALAARLPVFSIDKIQVQIAIPIRIKHRTARPHGLQIMPISPRARPMHKRYTRRFCDLHKLLCGSRTRT